MLNVHGTAVSGPGFPAQIWHLFMDAAIGNRPDTQFPRALTAPQWTSWQGQYQFSGAYGTTGTTGTTTGATTAPRTTRSVHTTTARPVTTAPATTTAPPLPPTTTETQPPPPTGITGTGP